MSGIRVHVWQVLLKPEIFLTEFVLDAGFESYNVNFFPFGKVKLTNDVTEMKLQHV